MGVQARPRSLATTCPSCRMSRWAVRTRARARAPPPRRARRAHPRPRRHGQGHRRPPPQGHGQCAHRRLRDRARLHHHWQGRPGARPAAPRPDRRPGGRPTSAARWHRRVCAVRLRGRAGGGGLAGAEGRRAAHDGRRVAGQGRGHRPGCAAALPRRLLGFCARARPASAAARAALARVALLPCAPDARRDRPASLSEVAAWRAAPGPQGRALCAPQATRRRACTSG